MSAAEHCRFDDLVSHYLDDALTTSDAAELVALLAEPSLAARFLETTRLNSEIAGLLAAPVPDAAMAELVRTDIERSLGDRSSGRTRSHIIERAQTIAATPVVSAPRRMPASRSLAWAAVLLAFAGLAAVILFHRGPVADVPVVASVQGEVRLVRAGGERAVMVGGSWQRDEELKMGGPNSAAIITFRDRTRLAFAGNTVAVNRSSKDGPRVQLDHGTVQAALKQQPAQRPFVFVTPEAEAIVVGTTLRLVTGGHHTRLEVTEGEVRFRRRHDGAEVAVKAGQYAVVAPNAPFVAMSFHPDSHAVH